MRHLIRKRLLKIEEEEIINVICRISDLDKWKEIEKVKTNSVVPYENEYIITGRIPDSKYQEIYNLPFCEKFNNCRGCISRVNIFLRRIILSPINKKNMTEVCRKCQGRGSLAHYYEYQCHLCRGSGRIFSGTCSDCGGAGHKKIYRGEVTCPDCRGVGEIR